MNARAPRVGLRAGKEPGILRSFELVMRFCLWAQEMHGDGPTAKQVAARFDVSRATAYRWLTAWRVATGRPPAARFIPSAGPRA